MLDKKEMVNKSYERLYITNPRQFTALIRLLGKKEEVDVLLNLCFWQGSQKKEFSKTDQSIAEETANSLRTIQRAKRSLKEKGLIDFYIKTFSPVTFYSINCKDVLRIVTNEIERHESTLACQASTLAPEASTLATQANTTSQAGEYTRHPGTFLYRGITEVITEDKRIHIPNPSDLVCSSNSANSAVGVVDSDILGMEEKEGSGMLQLESPLSSGGEADRRVASAAENAPYAANPVLSIVDGEVLPPLSEHENGKDGHQAVPISGEEGYVPVKPRKARRKITEKGYPEDFLAFLEAHPVKTGQDAAFPGWKAACIRAGGAAVIIAGAKRYADWAKAETIRRAKRGEGEPFLKWPQGWLSGNRWKDQIKIAMTEPERAFVRFCYLSMTERKLVPDDLHCEHIDNYQNEINQFMQENYQEMIHDWNRYNGN